MRTHSSENWVGWDCFWRDLSSGWLYRLIFVRRVVKQINFIGVKTILDIVLTGAFTRMMLALQIYTTLVRFGAEAKLGSVVALSLIKELGLSFPH